MSKELFLSYAYSFISYFFRDIKVKELEIKSIYLFGSVARGDFDKESDIDLFIECDNKETNKIIERTSKKFLNSEENKKFRLMGIQNEIKVIHGKLEEWDLKESVEKDGLILYSQTPAINSLKPFFLVWIKPIKDITKRNRVFRKLFGRQERYYKDKGLVSELNGEIIQTKVFIIQADKIKSILQIFSKEKIEYKIKKIWK